MEEGFNEDCACEATRELWLNIARTLAEKAVLYSDPIEIIRVAMLADACYWQATGIEDSISIKGFITQEYK